MISIEVNIFSIYISLWVLSANQYWRYLILCGAFNLVTYLPKEKNKLKNAPNLMPLIKN
jgi:hypothetical protein